MPRLTDTQLVILSAAASRDDRRVLPLPKSLKVKGAALSKTLNGLRKKGLLKEVAAAPSTAAWREAADGRRVTLVVTDAGLAAINGGSATSTTERPAPGKVAAKKRRNGRKVRDDKPDAALSAPKLRQGTKQARLIDLLQRKAGASIDEIVAATGWQAHSVRGAISGTVKKKLGHAVTSEKVDGRGRVYRIMAQH